MSVTAIVQALNSNIALRNQIGIYGWAAEQNKRAERVKKYRDYYDGQHDVKLTTEMKKMLREQDADSPFSANYCGLVVDKPTDRMKLDSISADNETATKWASDLLRRNRIDALALSVHGSTIKDGDTFILEEWDQEGGYVKFTHEPAYDGTTGMLALYDRANAEQPVCALKIWYITSYETVDGNTTTRDEPRVTAMYKDEIHRYVGSNGTLTPVTAPGDIRPGVQKNPIGRVPVIHFRNNATQTDNYGRSDLRNVIPLQNVLNRTLVSMVMTAENTSFQRLVVKNVGEMPPTVSPGGYLEIKDADENTKADITVLPAGEIQPYIDELNWAVNQIATITSTPLPGWEQNGESGEAKKQREEGLIGKVQRNEVGIGNSWEDALILAHVIQAEYSLKSPPAYTEFTAKWKNPQVRNDAEVVANAKLIKDDIPLIEYYRILAPVYGWSEEKIQEMVDLKEKQDETRMLKLQQPSVPMFNRQQQNITQAIQPGQPQAQPAPMAAVAGAGVAAR